MSAESSQTKFTVHLTGKRPLMFDRYPGDNKTKLEPLDKFYLNEDGQVVIPSLNVFSLLAAWNTPSVCKRFHGREGKNIATGIMAYVEIEGDTLTQDGIPASLVRDCEDKPYTPKDERIIVQTHVARTGQATPNPNTRPSIPPGWRVLFHITHTENDFVKLPTLARIFEQAGILGLGTFRPIFGRFDVEFDGI